MPASWAMDAVSTGPSQHGPGFWEGGEGAKIWSLLKIILYMVVPHCPSCFCSDSTKDKNRNALRKVQCNVVQMKITSDTLWMYKQ